MSNQQLEAAAHDIAQQLLSLQSSYSAEEENFLDQSNKCQRYKAVTPQFATCWQGYNNSQDQLLNQATSEFRQNYMTNARDVRTELRVVLELYQSKANLLPQM